MPIVAHQTQMSVVSSNPESYRFLKSEMASRPGKEGPKEIKLTFSFTKGHPIPTAYWINPPSRMSGYLPSMPENGNNTFSVWIPTDYPTDLNQLKFKLVESGNSGGKESDWTLTGFPMQTTVASDLKPSQDLEPGLSVSGTGTTDVESGNVTARLQATFGGNSEGWYWEARAASPYPPVGLVSLPESFQDVKLTSDSSPFYGQYPFAGLLDRITASGSVTHFVSHPEEATCQIKATPLPNTKPSESQWWQPEGEAVAVTPGGVRILIRKYNGGFGYSGPSHKKWLLVGISIDPTTLSKGLLRDPDRIDLHVSVHVEGEEENSSPQRDFEGLLPSQFKGPSGDLSYLITDDQVGPAVNLKISIDRRVADKTLPFSLVLPVKKPVTDTTPRA